MGDKILAKLFYRPSKIGLTNISNCQNKASLIDYCYFWRRVWPTVATHVESCELHKRVVNPLRYNTECGEYIQGCTLGCLK